ncbi:MAG: polysaccharide pyruvyl transferase family protein, partial [Opitutaceae bacterium]|nr:polysaccharide pyruvyl transferase family protein [Verrucomicrobiales bacterium]
IWKDGRRETLSIDELRGFLAHPYFAEVSHVGVTGGEPTLRKDLTELYRLLPECLPKLEGASFITHGMQTDRAVENYTQVHQHYLRLNLAFDGMVSIDGVGAVHDQVRGRKGAFDSATKTLLALKERGVPVIAACTIVRSNVYGLHDLLDWGKTNGVYVRFRVAEFIRRLYNEGCSAEVRSFNPRELRHLVSFFHLLLTEYETNETIQKTYRSILSLLTGGDRLIGCPYQKGVAVNVGSGGQVACCAPKGTSFAPASGAGEVHTVLQADREDLARTHCANCIHDYHDDWSESVSVEVTQARNRSQELYEGPDEQLTTSEVAAQSLNLAGMKEILLAGWYGTETAGDIAILQGIITEYLQVNSQLRFRVLSLFPFYTRTTIAEWPEKLRACVRVMDYASEEAWQATVDCDAVVMAGGPLMDIPQTRMILGLFKRFADLGKARVIEGCGVGPLHRADYRWNVCRIARLATRISVRDRASKEALRTYGIRKEITVRMDPAVTFLRAQGIRHHGSGSKVIRCFLRELTCEYPQSLSPEQAAENLATLLRNVLAWYPEHRVELWAMHHFPVGNDDRLFARGLVRKVENSRLTCDFEPRTPREIMEAMAAAEFCICMRFHSCVFASEIGVPFLAIDYTAGGKIAGFLEDVGQQPRLCGLGDVASLEMNELETKLKNPATLAIQTKPASNLTASNRPARILHIIQSVGGGGGARAMIALAKHSHRLGGLEHRAVSLTPADSVGLQLAEQAGLPILNQPGRAELREAMVDADIVLVHWWNNPELAMLFRSELPPMRLVLWLHVGGYHSPQVITPPLLEFADLSVACSPHTYSHPAFASLPAETLVRRTAMVLAGADFDRLHGVAPRAHAGFQVGYIGTLDPVKMHSEFVAMSCDAQVPDAKFVVCGGGDSGWLSRHVETLGRSASFEFKGHVEDLRPIIENLDVYGYPLCVDTYAAAELNLQEVMFAGLPVVAFPHGGIGRLVQ